MSFEPKQRFKLPLFKGESDNWEIFKVRFRSVARVFNKDSAKILDMVNKSMRKFFESEKEKESFKALSADAKKRLTDGDGDVKVQKFKDDDYHEANATLYAYLVQALDDETFDEYRADVNEDDGESLWRALVNEFDKKSLIELVGLLVEVFNFKMDEKTELKTYFAELANKITRLNNLGKELHIVKKALYLFH